MSKESFEKIGEHEKERVAETKVILEFMRHGQKDPNKTEPTKPDEEVRLTEAGRAQAVARGKELRPQPKVAMARRSNRKRTGETVLHAILANEEINPDASLEDMEKSIAKELRHGKKLVVDSRLAFGGNGPTRKELLAALVSGKLMSYLIEDSDRRALETKDTESSTYTRSAGNIAEILSQYLKVADNFNKLASQSDKYEEFGNQLERYLGTHQGILEAFVAKVLEVTQGKEKRDEFIKAVGTGFGETRGIRVEIDNKDGEQIISVTFELGGKKQTIELDKKIIEQIITDRKQLEEEINKV